MASQVQALGFCAAVVVLCGCGHDSTPAARQSGAADPSKPGPETSAEVVSFYTVDDYDPAANPVEDLVETVSQASANGKRILLEIGGQW